MPSTINQLLAERLGRIGGLGARWMARLLPSDVGEATLALEGSVEATARRVAEVLAALGEPVALDEPAAAGGQSAVLGTGEMGLNPAVVTVWVRGGAAGRCEVRIRGVAKEGLVRQRGGSEAVARVSAALAPPP